MNTTGMPDPQTLAAIRADIESIEAARRSARRMAWLRLGLFYVVLLAIIFYAGSILNGGADAAEQWTSTLHVYVYVLGLAAAIAGYFWATAPVRRAAEARRALLPRLFRFIDGLSWRKGEAPAALDRLPREIVGAFNRQTFDDVMTGIYKGFPFEVFEATLAQGSETALRGVGMAFEAAHPFPGILIAGRATAEGKGVFKGLFGKGSLEKVTADVADLDKAYEFRTDNPDAARPLIVGRLASAIKWLTQTWPEGQPLLALRGSDAFLLLPTERNYFQLPDPSQPFDFDADGRPMIADMVTLLETAALVRRVGGDGQAAG